MRTYADESIRHLMQVNGVTVKLKIDVDVTASDVIPTSTVRAAPTVKR